MQGKLQLALISSFAILLRCCITYHPHSGQGKSPMYGDYEAQRHWQEITFNLSPDKWYINTTDNDLEYWGLDYPPLTAYHSLLLSHVANKINTSFVKLQESKGLETIEHKHFMRLTVLIADILIYIPAMIYFVINLHTPDNRRLNEFNIFKFKEKDVIILTALIYPGLILIDHGHFQYNCVSLGFFIAAVTLLSKDSFILGSILFVLALNYKQMELYHALPIFFYILGLVSNETKSRFQYICRLMCVSSVVLLTFCIVWMPFLKSIDLFFNTMHRLFPFSRGIFEDKVANIWCVINVICKLRQIFTNAQLAKICLTLTICAVLPNCIDLYFSPARNAFIVSLINSSLAFFLFSFQVHEKSILLVAVPILLYFHNDPLPCFWFLIISHFSMLPLFIKDELYLAYLGTIVFYFCFVFWMWHNEFYNNVINSSLNKNKSKSKSKREMRYRKDKFLLNLSNYDAKPLLFITFYASILGVLSLSIISKFVKPPERYPDLFPLLVSIYSCGHFLMFFIYFHYVQLFMLKKENFPSKIKSH